MKPYFETLSLNEVIEMYQTEAISEKCFNKVADRICDLDWTEYDLVDLNTFIGVIIDDDVYHVNKFLT